jgi:hypothetical protein
LWITNASIKNPAHSLHFQPKYLKLPSCMQ